MLNHTIEKVLDDTAWALTEAEAAILDSMKQYYTAGFMYGANVSIPMRFANAISNHLRKCTLHPYNGGKLFPSSGMIWLPPDAAQILWNFYVELGRNPQAADDLISKTTDPQEISVLTKAKLCAETYPRGGGYTHSIPNFGRMLAEGLTSYKKRIETKKSETSDAESIDLYNALLVVVDAIYAFRLRVIDHLKSTSFNDEREQNRLMLLNAIESGLPMRPAEDFYQAMVSTTFLYALDGPDNLGRFDQFMLPYYERDIESGAITRNEALSLVKELWAYTDNCTAWNIAIGGTTRDGEEASSDFTLLCMEAAHNRRRPNLALRIRKDTPESVWDSAIDTILTGTGLPALYCEENYIKGMQLAELNIDQSDMYDYAFGGCTELMIHGCSNVGSLEGDFNVLKLMEQFLYTNLESYDTFEQLLSAFESSLSDSIQDTVSWMNHNQLMRSIYDPLLIRTLMIDDCIDRGLNYSNGGARYNWSVVNIIGLNNVLDSLSAIHKCIYNDKLFTSSELLDALRIDFIGNEEMLNSLKQAPHFGNDDEFVNALANRLSKHIYSEFLNHKTWRGGKFLCGTLMFVTYGMHGEYVGATPDGRRSGTPVGDSAGPVQGRDTKGPTAMLRSTASLAQLYASGTLVVNLRISRKLADNKEGRSKLKSLIRTYFEMGGLQLQINVVNQDILRDAIAHPENHTDLIVRVGGYSEYFNYLSPDLKESILERTEHM